MDKRRRKALSSPVKSDVGALLLSSPSQILRLTPLTSVLRAARAHDAALRMHPDLSLRFIKIHGIFWYPKQILTLAPVVASGEVVASMRSERQERQPRADSSSTAVLGGVMQRSSQPDRVVGFRVVVICETEGSQGGWLYWTVASPATKRGFCRRCISAESLQRYGTPPPRTRRPEA